MKLVGMNQNEFSVTFSKMEYHSGSDTHHIKAETDI